MQPVTKARIAIFIVLLVFLSSSGAYVSEPVVLPEHPLENDTLFLQFETLNCHGMGLIPDTVEVHGNQVIVTSPITHDTFCFPPRPRIAWEVPLGRLAAGDYELLFRRWEQYSPPIYEDLYEIEFSVGRFVGIPTLGGFALAVMTLLMLGSGAFWLGRQQDLFGRNHR